MTVLDYAKELLLAPGGVIHDPSGAIVPYEGGILLWGLLSYSSDTDDLVKRALDEFTKMQLGDGSFYQQYYPTRTTMGEYQYSGTALRVDSGASLLIIAMAQYDIKKTSTVYKTYVQKALAFLRACQVQHHNAYGKNLLANLITGEYPGGVWTTYAFAADCAEALIAAKYALDAYGATLLDSNGYSVKTFANDLYGDMMTFWKGGLSGDQDDNYFETAYPTQAAFPPAISFAQGLVARSLYLWYHSVYNTKPDYTYACARAINYAIALMAGKWGGFRYHPTLSPGTVYFGGTEEIIAYTACMLLGMVEVDTVTYVNRIAEVKVFIEFATEDDGRVWNERRINGALSIGVDPDSHFLGLNTGYMLLVKATVG
jgi:hypothetical protein